MHIPSLKEVVSAEEWQLRVDLAAAVGQPVAHPDPLHLEAQPAAVDFRPHQRRAEAPVGLEGIGFVPAFHLPAVRGRLH